MARAEDVPRDPLHVGAADEPIIDQRGQDLGGVRSRGPRRGARTAQDPSARGPGGDQWASGPLFDRDGAPFVPGRGAGSEAGADEPSAGFAAGAFGAAGADPPPDGPGAAGVVDAVSPGDAESPPAGCVLRL